MWSYDCVVPRSDLQKVGCVYGEHGHCRSSQGVLEYPCPCPSLRIGMSVIVSRTSLVPLYVPLCLRRCKVWRVAPGLEAAVAVLAVPLQRADLLARHATRVLLRQEQRQ